jgi:hypothetical protein
MLLSRGFGKHAVLIDLMSSREARNLAEHGNIDVSVSTPATLVRELEQLHKTHKKGLLGKWRRESHYKRELNALEFRLETMISSILDRMQDRIVEELAHRVVSQADASSARTPARVVDALQAQRRAVSRPTRER